MKPTKKAPLFASETELCADFMAWMSGKGWTCYPETAGWDILLVNAEGLQMGVQAKLRLNAKVILQAIEIGNYNDIGPDFRAILVPDDAELSQVADVLGLGVYTPCASYEFLRKRGINTGSMEAFDLRPYRNVVELHDWNPKKRHALPEFVPDVQAGASAPIQLTRWKIGALRVLAVLARDGSITRAQIKRCGCDPRAWTDRNRWLEPLGDGRFKLGGAPAFDQQHPKVYAEVVSGIEKVVPRELMSA